MTWDNAKRLDVINGDGYLFQMRVEQLIANIQPKPNNPLSRTTPWFQMASEYRWADRITGTEGFADFVLGKTNKQRLVVECKRFGSEKDTEWYFYVTQAKPYEPRTFAFATRHVSDSSSLTDENWVNIPANTDTFESTFASVQLKKNNGKGKSNDEKTRTLEAIASTVTRACEAIGVEEEKLAGIGDTRQTLYLPVIVTTAALWVCKLDPAIINLSTGTIPDTYLKSLIPKEPLNEKDEAEFDKIKRDEVEFQKVDYIRFTKSLSTAMGPVGDSVTLDALHEQRQRTVMIVSANALEGFLRKFSMRQ